MNAPINHPSPVEAKIRLFRSLFRGREDIYARRFESRKTGKSGYAPVCANEWVRGVCEKPRIKCAECPHRRFLAVTDDVIRWHLSGFDSGSEPFVAGIYPMLPDETCWFLAIDFDKSGWREDAAACLETTRNLNLPAALERSRSGRSRMMPIVGDLPEAIELVLGNQLYIAKEGLPPGLRNRLLRLAAFQNPEFYQAQALRLSTYGTPRIVACAEDFPQHIGLPRGCLDDVLKTLGDLTIGVTIRDERSIGRPLAVTFQGELRPEQKAAANALLAHDTGVLAATTAFGKTVIGAWLIAERRVSTLVLVHRRQLLDQWIERLAMFLGLPSDAIGRICEDIVDAVRAGRSPLVLTERNEHVDRLALLLTPLVRHVVVLRAGEGKKQRDATEERLAAIPREEERVMIATGKYVGEGFDDPRLDTLFLTLPRTDASASTSACRSHSTRVVRLKWTCSVPRLASRSSWTAHSIFLTGTPIAATVARTSCYRRMATSSCVFWLRTWARTLTVCSIQF